MSEADPELLQAVLDREGITAPAGGPTWVAWLVFRLHSLIESIWHAFAGSAGMGTAAWVVAALLVAVVGALTLFALLRLVARLVARDVAVSESGLLVTSVPEPTDLARFQEWAREALGAGRTEEAVRATWLWVAWSLDRRGLASYLGDLTNREFVAGARSRSPDWPGQLALAEFARGVEVACYAGGPVSGSEALRLYRAGASLLGETA